MKLSKTCLTLQRVVPLTLMLSLSACVMGSSNPQTLCPPVVPYSREAQAQVAQELATLPAGALIPGWLADYAVMRDQARACG
jgi:hypothetical protein